MMVKNLELMSDEIQQLKQICNAELDADQHFWVRMELRNLRSAEKGCPCPARFLNFYCADSPNWALIHDLRIEVNGEILRFDHILINRFFDIYLVDSTYFFFGLKITAEGQFLVFDGRHYRPVAPPLEAIERRARLLESIMTENGILPRRMGFRRRARLVKYILISPHSVVLRPPACILDTSMVVGADEFTRLLLRKTERGRKIKKMAGLSMLRGRALARFAERLAALHSATKIDYAARLNIDARTGRTVLPNDISRPLAAVECSI
jgi:hypothetical protein